MMNDNIRNRAKTLTALFLALILAGCMGSEGSLPSTQTTEDNCQTLRAAITAAAIEEATCTTHEECGNRRVDLCDVEGLGCYGHITNTSQPVDRLDNAIAAHKEANCPISKCKCESPASVFECYQGQCTAARCTEKVTPRCAPDSTCPKYLTKSVPCPLEAPDTEASQTP